MAGSEEHVKAFPNETTNGGTDAAGLRQYYPLDFVSLSTPHPLPSQSPALSMALPVLWPFGQPDERPALQFDSPLTVEPRTSLETGNVGRDLGQSPSLGALASRHIVDQPMLILRTAKEPHLPEALAELGRSPALPSRSSAREARPPPSRPTAPAMLSPSSSTAVRRPHRSAPLSPAPGLQLPTLCPFGTGLSDLCGDEPHQVRDAGQLPSPIASPTMPSPPEASSFQPCARMAPTEFAEPFADALRSLGAEPAPERSHDILDSAVEAFRLLDPGNTGTVKLEVAVRAIGAVHPTLTEKSVRAMLYVAKALQGDDVIYERFLQWVCQGA